MSQVGFEPTTYCLKGNCASHCATGSLQEMERADQIDRAAYPFPSGEGRYYDGLAQILVNIVPTMCVLQSCLSHLLILDQ